MYMYMYMYITFIIHFFRDFVKGFTEKEFLSASKTLLKVNIPLVRLFLVCFIIIHGVNIVLETIFNMKKCPYSGSG